MVTPTCHGVGQQNGAQDPVLGPLCWFADGVRGVVSAWLGIGVLSESEASIFYRLGKVSLPSNEMDYSLACGF